MFKQSMAGLLLAADGEPGGLPESGRVHLRQLHAAEAAL